MLTQGRVVSFVLLAAGFNGHFTVALPHSTALELEEYYISDKGDDAKSGKSPEDAFATVDRCLAEVRALRNNSGGKLAESVIFNFVAGRRGSTFVLGRTVEITPRESGDGDALVVFKSQSAAEPVTISGGYIVDNWHVDGKTWTAKLPDTIKPFHQLFINGQRRVLANTGVMQYEKIGQGSGLSDAWEDDYDYVAYRRSPLKRTDADPNFFVYRPGQVPASLADETGLEAIVYEIWTASVHQVAAIHPSNRTIYLRTPVAGRWEVSAATGHRYILQNSPQFLKPGSFYFDESTKVMTYYPEEGESPTMESVVPQLTELVTVFGNSTSGSKVTNIVFANLRFAHAMADYSACFTGECSDQSANFLTSAAIRFEFARNCAITHSAIAHVGGYGIWLDQACENNTLANIHVYDVGAGGVRIGRAGHVIDPELQTNFNVLSDSILEDGGHIFKEGCGVLLQAAAHNTITHNHIHHFHYTGVSIGWSWGYAATSSPGNLITYNHIHDIGMGDLSDMGCVYSLGIQIGAQVLHNLCHDVWSYGYGGWGYYTDEGSSNMTYAYNIAYHTKSACLHQHYGENNQFINNIFAYPHHIPCPDKTGGYCFDSAIKSSRHPAGSGPGAMSSFNFERNIIYISNGTLMSSSVPQDLLFPNQTFNNNIYWNTIQHANVLFPPKSGSKFSEWQAHGKDKNSLVADPLFLNASAFDFSELAKQSPALDLGFEPIDTANIGPRS